MYIYKITFKDDKQRFLELETGSIEELTQKVDTSKIKSIELIFEGEPEETFFERTKLLGEFEKQLEIIKTICSQSLKSLENTKDPLEPANIMDALIDHFKKLEEIYDNYAELLIFQKEVA